MEIRPKLEWKVRSSSEPGIHRVIGREDGLLRSGEFYRINCSAGGVEEFEVGENEMVLAVIGGSCDVYVGSVVFECKKLDTVYVPRGSKFKICGKDEGAIVYAPCARSELDIEPYKVEFDPNLPIGERRQIHGEGVGKRDVYMGVGPQDQAYRIISGYTWGQDGQWTSWPPHQHEKHLEEIYAYFDIPEDGFGLHLVFNEDLSDFYVHRVESGDVVAIPEGYHPTVAIPGVRNTYLWALFAHRHEDRRYDLAVPHPKIS